MGHTSHDSGMDGSRSNMRWTQPASECSRRLFSLGKLHAAMSLLFIICRSCQYNPSQWSIFIWIYVSTEFISWQESRAEWIDLDESESIFGLFIKEEKIEWHFFCFDWGNVYFVCISFDLVSNDINWYLIAIETVETARIRNLNLGSLYFHKIFREKNVVRFVST